MSLRSRLYHSPHSGAKLGISHFRPIVANYGQLWPFMKSNDLDFNYSEVRVPDPQNLGDPQNAGLGSGTSRQQNSHVEVNVLLSA